MPGGLSKIAVDRSLQQPNRIQMPHVFVAGLVHETHTFLIERTGLDAFEHTLWLRGEAMLARLAAGLAAGRGGESAQQGRERPRYN